MCRGNVGTNKVVGVEAPDRIRGHVTSTDIERLVGEIKSRGEPARDAEFRVLGGAAHSTIRQPNGELDRDKLLENVWGFAYPGETRTVDVHVKQLRDKLSGMNAKIETVWGVG